MLKKINLAIIFGSQSGEHEVSLASANSVIKALDKNKYNIIPIAITKKGNWLIGKKGSRYIKLYGKKAGKEDAISSEESQRLVTINDSKRDLFRYAEGDTGGVKIDIVLPLLHGPFGEDGRIQGMLDMLGVPYVFSGVLAQALAMNKAKANIIAKNVGVPVADNVVITKDNSYKLDDIIKKLLLPIVVKPTELGSSVGISIVKTKSELISGIEKAFRYGPEVMLEKFIGGRELTVAVIGSKNNPQVLPVIEIIPKISKFYDYKAKYQTGGSQHICPAKIPAKIKNNIQNLAIKIFKAIGCKDLARADFIWSRDDNKIYFIELNTIPGMTKTSLVPEAAKAAGIEFSQFLDKLINGAMFTNYK